MCDAPPPFNYIEMDREGFARISDYAAPCISSISSKGTGFYHTFLCTALIITD